MTTSSPALVSDKLLSIGEQKVLDHRSQILFRDSAFAIFVLRGQVDLFGTGFDEAGAHGRRRYLTSFESGALLLGYPEQGAAYGLMGVGQPDTEVLKVRLEDLDPLLANEEILEWLSAAVNSWIICLADVLQEQPRPRGALMLTAVEQMEAPVRRALSVSSGVLWGSTQSHELRYTGRLVYDKVKPIESLPLTELTWIVLSAKEELELTPTMQLLKSGISECRPLSHFGAHVTKVVEERHFRDARNTKELFVDSTLADQAWISRSLQRLARVNVSDVSGSTVAREQEEPPRVAAARIVCEAQDIELPKIAWRSLGANSRGPLEGLLDAAGVRQRKVLLRDEWWRRDNGSLLGFRRYGNEQEPVALLFFPRTGYRIVEPLSLDSTPVNKRTAATLSHESFQFYRSLNIEEPTPLDLYKFAIKGLHKEFWLLLCVGMVGGLLATIVPIATGQIFDQAIPSADKTLLFQLVFGIIAIALGRALFQITLQMTSIRIETRMNATMQAAVWDRLLRLPPPFFRSYTAGDLSSRASGIDAIRSILSGVASTTILGGFFSVWNVLLMFYFSPRLAMAGIGIILVTSLIPIISFYFMLRIERARLEFSGKISGLLLEFLWGMPKLRSSGTENRAFARWANEFSRMRRMQYQSEQITNVFDVLQSSFDILSLLILFAMMGEGEGLSVGMFLAFMAAYGAFSNSFLGMVYSGLDALEIIPLWERAQPILLAKPETASDGASPGVLSGDIEVANLSFGYIQGAPLTLNNVSFKVKSGEFVALVGPSGAGKSTVMRMLLGFERPNSGGVFYDAQPLSSLDIRAVRNQLGVVLQDNELMGGDVFTNIVGHNSTLSMEEAWEAAEKAALAEDIRKMPMGMHTVVSESGDTLSGGQRQRLFIARALAQSPRILFLDEATSALDNATQAAVSESLEHFQGTRIVVAHRLSTIINADRILVFERGQIVESGGFEHLMSLNGVFATLARRQIA